MKSIAFALTILCGAQAAYAAPARHATLPSVSPDGKRITFDGSKERQITR